jgi:hypothetical protein
MIPASVAVASLPVKARSDAAVSALAILSLAFSAAGPIATGGWDATMRFWCSP